MEIEIVPTGQCAEININRPAKPIPAGESLFLLTLKVPERIADVLQVESNAVFFEPLSFAAPFSEQMSVRSSACLMAVRPAECFLLWSCEDKKKRMIRIVRVFMTKHSEHQTARTAVCLGGPVKSRPSWQPGTA